MSATMQQGLGLEHQQRPLSDWEVVGHQPSPDVADAQRYGMLANGAAHAAAQHSEQARGHAELSSKMLEAFRAEVSQIAAFAEQAATSAMQAVAAAQKATDVAVEVGRLAQEITASTQQARGTQDAHDKMLAQFDEIAAALSRAVEAMAAPRKVVRDGSGRITEVKAG